VRGLYNCTRATDTVHRQVLCLLHMDKVCRKGNMQNAGHGLYTTRGFQVIFTMLF
jgi:hypothetical protein